MFYTY
jgi:hypothetical protein